MKCFECESSCHSTTDITGAGATDEPPQHYYPPDSSIPGRVPDFYFNLSVIYFVLITIGALLCYPYDKNDPYFRTVFEDEMPAEEEDEILTEDREETHSLMTGKSSPSASSARKSFHLESETDVSKTGSAEASLLLDRLDSKPEYSAGSPNSGHTLELSPYDLVFEPMCHLFEMCMVFTNVGGEISCQPLYSVNPCTHAENIGEVIAVVCQYFAPDDVIFRNVHCGSI